MLYNFTFEDIEFLVHNSHSHQEVGCTWPCTQNVSNIKKMQKKKKFRGKCLDCKTSSFNGCVVVVSMNLLLFNFKDSSFLKKHLDLFWMLTIISLSNLWKVKQKNRQRYSLARLIFTESSVDVFHFAYA
jgi:hypothetical protein